MNRKGNTAACGQSRTAPSSKHIESFEKWGTLYHVFPGVDLVKIHFQTNGMKERRKEAEVLEINFCVSGRFETAFSSAEQVTLTPGDMAISMHDGSAPAETWSAFPLGYYEGLAIMADIKEATAWMKQNAGSLAVDLSEVKECLLNRKWYWFGSAGPRCEHVFRELYECASLSGDSYLQLKVIELFILLIRTNNSGSFGDYYPKTQIDIVKHIRDHLISQFAFHSRIEELTKEHNISVSQFRKVFRTVYGKPVYQYVMEYRLDRAAIELSETGNTITEIAYELGFSNPSKFSESFKRRYGVTPRQYRMLRKRKIKSDICDKNV